jgi:hypothetical protein
MDPILTLAGIVAKLSIATSHALSYAKFLEKSEKRYRHITNSLESAVDMLQRLAHMKQRIEKLDDVQLRSLNITVQTFEQFKRFQVSVEALSKLLRKQKSRVEKKSWFAREVIKATFSRWQQDIFSRQQQDDGLHQAWEHFMDNQSCLTTSISILNTYLFEDASRREETY